MTIATRQAFMQALAEGKGFCYPHIPASSPSLTAAAAGSGFFTVAPLWNSLGTTFPGTLVDIKGPPITAAVNLAALMLGTTAARTFYLARLYRFGVQVLTATGDQFTHDSWTAPLTRTQFGQASQPLTLIPLIMVTTALTVTAAILTLKTAAGGTGYVDQDNNNVVGTKTFTFPSATSAVQSCYIMRLEDGDCGVRDIVACQTNTAATAGAASIFGVELLAMASAAGGGLSNVADTLFSGLDLADLQPAAPTSGSFTQTFLAMIGLSSNAATQPIIVPLGAVA